MSQYLSEAFKSLDSLNEDIFSIDENGLQDLVKFEEEDEDTNIIDIIDAEAETHDDLEDSYEGKIILDCSICHSKQYKNIEDVVIEGDLANIGEECPFCYTNDGFKVIGQVASFNKEEAGTEEEEKPEETKTDKKDTELKEAVGTLERPMSGIKGTLGNVLTAHADELSRVYDAQSAIELLDRLEPEIDQKDYLKKVKLDIMRAPRKAVNYLYNIILKGDGMGRDIEEGLFNKNKQIFDVWGEYKGEPKLWTKNQTLSKKEAEKLAQELKDDGKGETYVKPRSKDLEEGIFGNKTDKSNNFNDANLEVEKVTGKSIEDVAFGMYELFETCLRELGKHLNKNYGNKSDMLVQSAQNALNVIPLTVKALKKPNNYLHVFNILTSALRKVDSTITSFNSYQKLENYQEILNSISNIKFEDKNAAKEIFKSFCSTIASNLTSLYNSNKSSPMGLIESVHDESKSINEGTLSRVINKIRRATLDEHDPNNRKLYNFIDKFKKEFGINCETHNAGYGYLPDDDTEVRNYRMYLKCGPEIIKQFFIDGKAYKGLKPEYADRFTMNGARNRKANYEMSDGEIQVEIGLDTIYFDLHVIMDSEKADRDREKFDKRFAKAYKNESKSIREDVNNVNVETDEDIINVSTDGNGKITVTTEPKTTEVETGEEIITPLEPEVQNEIKDNVASGDEIEIDVDEFDEESFDELGESYLKKIYENVDTYKTSQVYLNNNTLKVEGLIKFKSGNTKKTSFLFEARTATKTGKVKFIGENTQITKGKKAFTITGNINNKKFLSESLTYNYGAKTPEGKTKRLYGTIKK